MSSMKPRDVILDALELGVPDRVPVAFFGAGVWTLYNAGNSFSDLAYEPKKMANTIISASEKLQSDIVYAGSGYNNFHAAALGGKIKIRGVEALMRDIFKNPTFAQEVVNFSADMIIKFFEPFLDEGVIDLITVADPTASGDLISKVQYEKFALPPIQDLSKFARNKGARVLLHVCGDTTDRLDLMAQTGVDCFSLDHKVDIGHAKEQLRGKMCIGGNVDPVHVLASGTEEDVKIAAKNCIEKAANGGGYILMPGCDHPPTTPLKNIRAFVNSAV